MEKPAGLRGALIITAFLATLALLIAFQFAERSPGEVASDSDGSLEATVSVEGSSANPDAPQAPGSAPPPRDRTVAPDGPSGAPGAGSPRDATSRPVPPPDAPTPAGEELERLSTPPEQSVWALSPDTYDEGVSIAVEFSPYGIGPDTYGPSVVVLIDSSKPASDAKRTPDLTGRNAVLTLGQAVVKTGGRYQGEVVLSTRGDRLVLLLENATLLDR